VQNNSNLHINLQVEYLNFLSSHLSQNEVSGVAAVFHSRVVADLHFIHEQQLMNLDFKKSNLVKYYLVKYLKQ